MNKFVEFPLEADEAALQLSGGLYKTVNILIGGVETSALRHPRGT